MSFNDVFKSSFLESVTQFSLIDTLIALIFSLVVGLFIFVIYKKTLTGVLYSSGLALTLVGLTTVTTLVIMAVTSNVVLSLGMVGALSIVRFRAEMCIRDSLYTGLEQGQPYVLSVGSITRLGGRASQVQAMLCDLTASAAGPSYTLSVTQALQQVQITPPTQAGRTWSLLMYIGLNGETAGNVLRFERVQLEKGLQRTDWTPAPEDPVAALTTSNGITINSQGVFIDTNRFDLNLLDNTGESVLSMSAAGIGGFQQLRAQHIQTTQLLVDGRPWRQEETVNLYVNGASGNDSNSGASAARAFLTIQAALDSLPKCLNASVEINIASG